MQPRGKFITFEGAEGCGKSTHARSLCAYLADRGTSVRLIREPGGVVISEKIREILLENKKAAMVLYPRMMAILAIYFIL